MEKCNLPENMMINILSRLPVKSLLRFKCVSKSWYVMFKSPTFIANHLRTEHTSSSNHNNKCLLVGIHNVTDKLTASVLSVDTLDSLIDLELPKCGHDKFEVRDIYNSCNGIVCLFGAFLDAEGGLVRVNGVCDRFFLLNPATREYKSLPPPLPLSYPSYVHSSTKEAALGFDSKTNDYKVVRIVCLFDNYRKRYLPSMVQMYSLRSNSWRDIDVVVPACIPRDLVYNTYTNGTYNWFGFDKKGSLIVSFDMADEVFRTRRVPEFDEWSRDYAYGYTILNGAFSLIAFPYEGMETYTDIWVMNDEEDSWTKQFTIGPIRGANIPLAIWGNIRLFFDDIYEGGDQVFLYDHSTHESRKINVYSFPHALYGVSIYKESLVSIN